MQAPSPLPKHKVVLVVKRIVKIILWVLAACLLLLLLLIATIQIPPVQKILREKLGMALTAKLHTRVEVGNIGINLLGKLVITRFCLPDDRQDTLLVFQKLSVGINPLALLHQRVMISSVSLAGAHFWYSIRDTAGRTNLDFVLRAFDGDGKKPKATVSNWQVEVQKVVLEHCSFTMLDADGLRVQCNAGNLALQLSETNLSAMRFTATLVSIKNGSVQVVTSGKSRAPKSETSKPARVSVAVHQVNLKNVSVDYRDLTSGLSGVFIIGEMYVSPKRIDIARQKIVVDKLTLVHGKVALKAAKLQKAATRITTIATPKPGWAIELSNASIGLDSMHLDNFVHNASLAYLTHLSFSNIAIELDGMYQSSANWEGNLRKLQCKDDKMARDISLSLRPASASGRLDIQQLCLGIGTSYITGMCQADLTKTGKDRIPDFQLDIHALHVKDIRPYLPARIAARLPVQEDILLKGTFSSQRERLAGAGTIGDGSGKINFTASYNAFGSSDEKTYQASIDISKFSLGRLLKDSTLGPVSGRIMATGQGFDPEVAAIALKISVDSVFYKNKPYRDIRIDGHLSHGDILATVESANPSASVKVILAGRWNHRQPEINLKAEIRKIDLRALGIYKDTLSVDGNLSVWLTSHGKKNFESHADTFILRFTKNKRPATISSHWKYSVASDSTVEAAYTSEVGTLAYHGNLGFQDIPSVLQRYVKDTYTVDETDKRNLDKHFKFSLVLNDISAIKAVIPLPVAFSKGSMVTGELSSNKLSANIHFNKLSLPTTQVDSLNVKAEGRGSQLHFILTAAAIHDSIHTIRNLECQITFNNGKLDTRTQFSNSGGKPWFDFGITAILQKDAVRAAIQEPLMLNYANWTVNNNNSINYTNKTLSELAITLRNGDKEFSIVQDPQNSAKLRIGFQNLNMHFFSELWKDDTTTLGGSMSGKLSLQNIFGKTMPLFDADIAIRGIDVAKQSLGDVRLLASNTANPDVMALNLYAGNSEMSLLAKGEYALKDNLPMNLSLTVRNFNLASLSPIVQKYITNPSGHVNASLNISGIIRKPVIEGSLGFDNVSLFVNQLHSAFNIHDEKLQLNGSKVNFSSFTIRDDGGNPLILRGSVSFAEIKNISYQLQINTENFTLYNSAPNHLPTKDTKLIITSDMQFTGNLASPVLRAKIQVEEGSKLYYEMNRMNSTFSEKGIIEFTKTEQTVAAPPRSVVQNLNITANVTLADETPITLITNLEKGEGLNLLTGGVFTYSQLPLQSPRLAGKASISGGQYTMNLSGLRKSFKIVPQSTLRWNGDIADPEFTIQAYYEVRAAPGPILADQIQGASASETSQYANPLPFYVYANIKGSLALAEFNFSIALPDEYEGIYNGMVASRLQQINSDPSDVNVQAVSLLLFGTFDLSNLSNIVLGNQNGKNMLISNALNQFASQKIRFANLHFDLQSFDNYGESSLQDARTELKTEASRKFFNNRLNAKVGAGILLQGDPAEQLQKGFDKVTPTFNLEYILNKNKTISIKAFRQDDYKGLIEGKVVSTGTGIKFQKDYDMIREIFEK